MNFKSDQFAIPLLAFFFFLEIKDRKDEKALHVTVFSKSNILHENVGYTLF